MEERPSYYRPVQHRYTRRRDWCDYHAAGRAYMITLTIEEDAALLSEIGGTSSQPVLQLLPLGEALKEAWLLIPQRYEGVAVLDDEYVVMPEHFHGIVHVEKRQEEHLSSIIKSFKSWVYQSYRIMMAEGAVQPVGLGRAWLEKYLSFPLQQRAEMLSWLHRSKQIVLSGSKEKLGYSPIHIVASGLHNKTGFLFRVNYTDTIPLNAQELQEKITYIHNNPVMRLLSRENPDRMRLRRGALPIERLTVAFIRQYLCKPDVAAAYLRNMPPQEAAEKLDAVCKALLADEAGNIVCDVYGDMSLLSGPKLLPVVCHRADNSAFALQKQRCLEAAAAGCVLVSARIARGEQEIIDAAIAAGYPVVLVSDNGFEDKQHPGAAHRVACAQGLRLFVIPWHFEYNRPLNPLFSKAMNAIVQGLCHQKDNWWR